MSLDSELSWQSVKIGDLGKVVTGGTPPTQRTELFGDAYPFITPTDMTDTDRHVRTERYLSEEGYKSQSQRVLPNNAVCFVCIGATIGKICLTDRTSFTNQQINSIVVDETHHDPRFIYYLLRTQGDRVKGIAGGAATPIVNKSAFANLEVTVPPFPTQRKIADILSAYDDLIENNTRRIKILEEMAQTIYREWFVHFRFPGHEQVEMVETELGLIPDDWRVVKLGEVSTSHRGRSYRSQDLVSLGGLPFLNLKCIERGGGFRHDGIKRYGGVFKDSQTARPGDVVVAVTDMTQERRLVAHAARVPLMDHSFAVMSMDLVRVEPHEEIAAGYLHGLLRFSDFSDTIKQHANGVNVLHLNPQQIHEFSFVLPSKTFRDKYGLFSNDLYRQCDVLQRKNSNLRQTRDLLLPKLVSGEVEITASELDEGALA